MFQILTFYLTKSLKFVLKTKQKTVEHESFQLREVSYENYKNISIKFFSYVDEITINCQKFE